MTEEEKKHAEIDKLEDELEELRFAEHVAPIIYAGLVMRGKSPGGLDDDMVRCVDAAVGFRKELRRRRRGIEEKMAKLDPSFRPRRSML